MKAWPLLALFLTGAASAAPLSVMESASYPMSDEESRNAGRQHCVEAAKHTALDRAGSVFEAEMKSERSESGQDDAKLKLRSYFAGVVSSEMVGDKVDVDTQGRATETCTVRIGYDPETVTAKMHEIADAEGLRKQVAEQQTTIASLQSQVRQTQAQPPPPAAAPLPLVQTAQLQPPAPAAVPATSSPPVPHALVPYTPPAPRPVYYAPPAPAPVYYAPPAAVPRPVYYAPPPVLVPIRAPVAYYAPVAPPPVVILRPPVRVRVARVFRRLFYWP